MSSENMEESPSEQTIHVGHIGLTTQVYSVDILMRIYYSTYHLWAAKHFAQLAKEIEDAHTGPDTFSVEHRAYVTNTIFSAVAFIEAAINEVFQDSFDNYDSYVGSLGANNKTGLSKFWGETEAKGKHESILDKYQKALECAKKQQFDRGRSPYQDAKLTIDIRDALTHWKPRTLGADKEHELAKQLRSKNFRLNKLMENSANPIFPDLYLGYGCAAWVIESSENLANEFFKRIGITPNYQMVTFDK